ncbi:hypothetical protein ACLB2K_058247 [Fragaria x ananassa]
MVDAAKKVLEKAKEKQVRMLPTDVAISKILSADANREAGSPPAMGMDIGKDFIKRFTDGLGSTMTIIWSGPMGVSEFDNFAVGTEVIATKLADLTEKGGSFNYCSRGLHHSHPLTCGSFEGQASSQQQQWHPLEHQSLN